MRRARQASDFASERHEVVLAKREDVDVSHDDHLVMILCKDRVPNNVCSGWLLIGPYFHVDRGEERKAWTSARAREAFDL